MSEKQRDEQIAESLLSDIRECLWETTACIAVDSIESGHEFYLTNAQKKQIRYCYGNGEHEYEDAVMQFLETVAIPAIRHALLEES